MIAIRQTRKWGLWGASWILLLCIIHASFALATEPRPPKIAIAEGRNTCFSHPTKKAGFRADREARTDPSPRHLQNIRAQGEYAPMRDLRFAHLTTNDGLSQSYVNAILQDRRGFMWFGTRDGLNRYDGNDFVVYKHNPNNPDSLSANFVEDLIQDDQGYLWVATFSGGVDKFDPKTQRFIQYRHDPSKPNSIGSDWVESVARDSRGDLWFGTGDSGLDRFDPSTGTFTHYLDDSDGRFLGEITDVIADSRGNIWFVGERGLFHLNPQTGQITRPSASIGLAADCVYEDNVGNLWMLAYSPSVGLVKYDRKAERVTKYPVSAGAVGVANSKLLADGQKGFWVPSNQGLYYFDRRTERFTYRFQNDETNPNSLNDNTVVSIYQDTGGLLWVGTENGGLNLLDLRQERFGYRGHHSGDPNSLSLGEVTAVYEEPNGILWLGFYPRALDRLDLKTGQVTHYLPDPENKNALGKGRDVNGIYQDAHGYLWLSGWEAGLDRFDERTGQFKHYRHNPDDPNSLLTNYVFRIYGDRSGQLWVGQNDGISRLDPVTGQFTNYGPDPKNRTSYGNWAVAIYQDRSGTLWFGRGGGVLSRFDDKTKTFVNNMPDSLDPHRLQGGSILAIHEDRAGTLWVGATDGLYRFNRQKGIFAHYTESQGLPDSDIECILEDKAGRLWLSTKKGISRFDPQTETFRNYDVSDGLESNEFSKGCYHSQDGEMFFGGSSGFNAFFPEKIRDNPFVPPVVLTNFKIFNQPVSVGAKSVLKQAIPYADSLTLSYRNSAFSFEFAALSYANSQKNRYRYELEPLERSWNEVGSKQRLANYTNLGTGKYIFRVQGSNSDGVWNQEGASLPIIITPPWWKTNWFRATWLAALLGLLWALHQLRVRQIGREFSMTLEARVGERTRIARELHDTLLQSYHGLLFQFQAVRNMLPGRPEEAMRTLDSAISGAEQALAESREAIQDLRSAQVTGGDLAQVLTETGQELAGAQAANGNAPTFYVIVEGDQQALSPIVQHELHRIAREVLRNAFCHAQAQRVEVEIRYDDHELRVRIRDDGKGMDPKILEQGGSPGHWGLRGVLERAERIGAKLDFWSEVGAGTEVQLSVPAAVAYQASYEGSGSRHSRKAGSHEQRS
jgi:ligand-binding sensor domain-containing protein/signal transduction histidine kinase